MRHSIAVKFLAVILCALSVVSVAACSIGIIFMEGNNLYNESLQEQKYQQLEYIAQDIAWNYAQRHAAESMGNCPVEILEEILPRVSVNGEFAVSIFENAEEVYTFNSPEKISGTEYSFTYTLAPNYPVVAYRYSIGEDGTRATEMPSVAAETTEEAVTEADQDSLPARSNSVAPLFTDEHIDEYWENGVIRRMGYVLNYYQGPEYTVKVYLSDKVVQGTDYALMSLLYPYRDLFIPVLLAGLVVFAVTLVFLCAAAGRTKGGEIVPAGLNRLPLDLYAGIAAGGILVLLALMVNLLDSFYMGYYSIWDNLPLCMLILAMGSFFIALLLVGLMFAFCAQVKLKNGYWWRHSLIGKCLALFASFLGWIRRGLRYCYRGCRAVVRMLPVIWQWLLTAFLMAAVPALFLLFAVETYGGAQLIFLFLLMLSLLADVVLVCYGGWCFGNLLKGIRSMSKGELDPKLPSKYFYGTFREFADQLREVAGAARIAVEQQMKSERMKTELITNVSHDIKTPLTSIINYVDLLKKSSTEEEKEQYLEVLDRQSQRLKKLVDDLMEMSKASSGNVSVELENVDAAEAINQALGEFADKLDRVGLTPVFRHPEFPVTMRADGKLVWRVMSNILNNAVKYAMPNTRLYVDLMVLQGNAVIAVKNISREQLNVNADELMERFVRGDSSRNTEGSGLGLNIAKSLVELQNGQMHLMVDGDLFKVTLIFPCA